MQAAPGWDRTAFLCRNSYGEWLPMRTRHEVEGRRNQQFVTFSFFFSFPSAIDRSLEQGSVCWPECQTLKKSFECIFFFLGGGEEDTVPNPHIYLFSDEEHKTNVWKPGFSGR